MKELKHYAIDGMFPSQVETPTSIDELSSALFSFNQDHLGVIPFSGCTRIHIGNIPTRYDVALDLGSMPQFVDHQAGDLTLVTTANMSLASVDRLLHKAGQRLPFTVPSKDNATIGGSVASNAHGELQSSLGAIRDWILGMQVLSPNGNITKTGGNVVKNVQGYDLHRLHTGAFGTLGIITQVNFKLLPMPSNVRTIAVWFHNLQEAVTFATEIFRMSSLPEAFSLFVGKPSIDAANELGIPKFNSDPNFFILTQFSGVELAVNRQIDNLIGTIMSSSAMHYQVLDSAESKKLWVLVSKYQDQLTCAVKANFKPANSFLFLEDLLKLNNSECSLSGHVQAGYGSVFAGYTEHIGFPSQKTAKNIFELVDKHSGSAVLERCPTSIKSGLDIFGKSPHSINLMRSIKRMFDPNNTLNPGRFMGRI